MTRTVRGQGWSELEGTRAICSAARAAIRVCPTRDIVNTLDRAHGEHFFLLLV